MKERPSYYANIPASVRYDKELSANAKLLYGEITALCNKEGFCWASNQYFADLYDTTPRSIREWVSKLAKQGYIEVEIVDKVKRKIFLGVGRNLPRGRKKSSGEVGRKLPHNNTVNNTENITTNSEHSSRGFNPLGAQIIKEFETVDPRNKTYYANKTQRSACDFLISEYGLDETLSRVRMLNRANDTPYFPTITTPVQLRDKWVQLEKALIRAKQKVQENNVNVI